VCGGEVTRCDSRNEHVTTLQGEQGWIYTSERGVTRSDSRNEHVTTLQGEQGWIYTSERGLQGLTAGMNMLQLLENRSIYASERGGGFRGI
jgi:hypothetical protein